MAQLNPAEKIVVDTIVSTFSHLPEKVTHEDVTIAATDGDLIMVQTVKYVEDHMFNQHTRGAVWRVENGVAEPVFLSLGYPLEVECDEVKFGPSEDPSLVCFSHETQAERKFPVKHNVVFTPYFEGLVVRLCVYKGKKYWMTHTRFTIDRFKWGQADLEELIKLLGLPTHEEVFGEINESIITGCAHYMVTHPTSITLTRLDLNGHGFISSIGTIVTHVANAPWKSAPLMSWEEFPYRLESNLPVFSPPVIPISEVNDMLRSGYYSDVPTDDNRIRPGEILMAIIDGRQFVKLHPISAIWREKMRGGETSIRSRFWYLASEAYDKDVFRKQYVFFKEPANRSLLESVKEQIIERREPFIWEETEIPSEAYLDSLTKDNLERVRVIYLNLLLSIPFSDQTEFVGLYDEYVNGMRKLVNFIMAYRKKTLHFYDPKTLTTIGSVKQEKTERLPGHVYHLGVGNLIYDITEPLANTPLHMDLVLVDKMHTRSLNILEQAINYTTKGMKGQRVSDSHFDDALRNNVRFLVFNEHGKSLYQMVRQTQAWVLPDEVPARPSKSKSEKYAQPPVGYNPTQQKGRGGSQRGRGGSKPSSSSSSQKSASNRYPKGSSSSQKAGPQWKDGNSEW